MSTTPLVSLDEYLNTSYEPDMDFVDGVLLRRNVGTQLHGLLQTILAIYFGQYRRSHRIQVFTETRLLVNPVTGRHRVPDIMVVPTPYAKGKVMVDVPAVTVEIKSPDDTFDDILDRCFDYGQRGVLHVLVMDPDKRRAWSFEHGDLRLLTEPAASLALPERPAVDFPWRNLFAELEAE